MACHASDVFLTLKPAQVSLRAERKRQIKEAMCLLPPHERAVLEYLFWEEPPLTSQAVAERVGVAPGSVSILRARGLKQIAEILAPQVRHW